MTTARSGLAHWKPITASFILKAVTSSRPVCSTICGSQPAAAATRPPTPKLKPRAAFKATSLTAKHPLSAAASDSGKLILGEGTMVLSNRSTANAFAPASIQVDSGATLQLTANEQIGNTTGLILNGGTATAGFSEKLGTLTLTSSSTIDLGAWSTGVRQLTFAGSSAIAWTGTLTITNWQGVAFQSSDVAEIIFGTGGLTSTQLGQVYWANQNISGSTLLGAGELVTIPEPRTYAAVVCLLFVVGWRERKRILGLLQRSA